MPCKHPHALVGALVDGEVVGEEHRAAAAEVATCPVCALLAEDYRRIGRQILAAYQPAPSHLGDRIRARLAQERAASPRATGWSYCRQYAGRAAVLLAAVGVSALTTWSLQRSTSEQALLQREIVTAHLRSLLHDSPVQIASSDRHAVKPWFSGRLDFAPAVQDLSANGFPLIGARLDLVDDRRIAAIVYKRRQHVINVFMWPAPGSEAVGPRLVALKGYSAISWTVAGMSYWAVSDLNAKELGQLQGILAAP